MLTLEATVFPSVAYDFSFLFDVKSLSQFVTQFLRIEKKDALPTVLWDLEMPKLSSTFSVCLFKIKFNAPNKSRYTTREAVEPNSETNCTDRTPRTLGSVTGVLMCVKNVRGQNIHSKSH